ncbi:MAG: translation initiation factor IF-2 [Hyphomicrobiaceae bacterium]
MSDSKETTEKTGATGGRKPLSLSRTVESGHVQQKFSHGRMKSVVVEKKKKRTLNTPGEEPAGRPAPTGGGQGGGARNLSDQEMVSRARALAAAQVRAVEEERQRAEEAKRVAAEEAERQRKAQEDTARAAAEAREAAIARAREAEARAQEPAAPVAPPASPAAEPVEAEPTASAPPPAAAPRGAEAPPARTGYVARERAAPSSRASEPLMKPVGMTRPQIVTRTDRPQPKPPEAKKAEVEVPRRPARPAPGSGAPARAGDEDEGTKRKVGGKVVRTPGPAKGGDDKRIGGKLTLEKLLNTEQRERSLASLKRKREREKMKAMGIVQPREKITREVVIPEAITIQELANRMTERSVDVIKYLMKQGAMHKINDVIDADTAELIVTEFGHTPKRVSEADVLEGFISTASEGDEHLEPRPPVVTIMGHVDHGKTSLLDAIRKANVASGEAGGITQHIGAYQVMTPTGDRVTFIDTPGHEAFTAMRARGAKVTDIVILVVAADDGVKPQTVEAIAHAKAAGVPMIVAINKIDKPGVDPNRVRTDLLQHEVVVESMSGETQDVEVSALKQMNLDKLLEAISLQAEILDLKANPNRSAEGFVIEAKLERGRGPVGTLLVQRGTLKIGDIVVAGMAWGRVRALIDGMGTNVKEAGPSFPVEVLGFDSAPEAGDQFAVVESEARAREITDYRIRKRRETLGPAGGTARTLEQMMQQLKDSGRKEFTLIVKGDVQGSVEAIAGALKKISTDEVEARIIHSGVGAINESDIGLANASGAVIVGFNVRANAQAKAHAERDGVEIRYYNIIYDLVDDVKAAMSGLLAPTIREVFLGNAQVLQVFNISKVGKVAGCRVTEGKVERGAKVRLIRDNVVIHEGSLSVLKRFKDDVKEVSNGQECGMSFANYQDLREGDVIECFQVETVARTL